jgi:hypothetical protein
VTGDTGHKLRGDYSRMRPDYTVDQEWGAHSPEEHALWRRLYQRQAALIPDYACDEFIDTLKTLAFGAGTKRVLSTIAGVWLMACLSPLPSADVHHSTCPRKIGDPLRGLISHEFLRWLDPAGLPR